VAVESCVQDVPLKVQVSLRSPPLPDPPNRTMFPVAGSLAMEAYARAGGLVAVESCVQDVPLKVHVSLRSLVPLDPPNRKMFPMAG
jgi:hypothetical protein